MQRTLRCDPLVRDDAHGAQRALTHATDPCPAQRLTWLRMPPFSVSRWSLPPAELTTVAQAPSAMVLPGMVNCCKAYAAGTS
jgi:hypothetical protein